MQREDAKGIGNRLRWSLEKSRPPNSGFATQSEDGSVIRRGGRFQKIKGRQGANVRTLRPL